MAINQKDQIQILTTNGIDNQTKYTKTFDLLFGKQFSDSEEVKQDISSFVKSYVDLTNDPGSAQAVIVDRELVDIE